MDHLYVTWEEYHQHIEQLAAQVYASGWAFDEVLCVARGGLRVGDVLSRIFDKPLGVLFTSSYRENAGTQQGELLIAESISSALPMKGPRILLADDLVDTGATYLKLIPLLKERHPQFKEIRTAVLWTKSVAQFQPDYSVKRLKDSPWIHQPFERYDTLRPEHLGP